MHGPSSFRRVGRDLNTQERSSFRRLERDGNTPRPSSCFGLTGQRFERLGFVEFHRTLELRWADLRVDLRRLEAHVAEHRAHCLEVVLGFENLHRDTVPEIVGFNIGYPISRP